MLDEDALSNFLDWLGQPKEHRRDAENAEVTQRVEFVLRPSARNVIGGKSVDLLAVY